MRCIDNKTAEILARHPAARVGLIEARMQRGLKQYEAAALRNVSWPYYSLIEIGEVTPYPELAARITKLTGYEWEET